MGILSETTISLQDAAASLPSGMNRGRPLSFSTVWRWVLRGCLALDEQRIKLEAIRLGGRWLTSREALERFSAALIQVPSDVPTPLTPTARNRSAAKSQRRLEAAGI